MKSSFLKSASVFITIASLAACASNEIGHSKDVNQDEINQGYSINYNEADNKTEITAFFRFAGPNGTTLILDKPSKVTLQREPLQENQSESTGAYYAKSYNGELPDGDYELVFTDINSKAYSNKFKWRNIRVDSVPLSIERNEDLLIKFSKDPDSRFEEIEVQVSDTAQTVTETFKNVMLKRVAVKADKLKELHGELKVTVKRYGYRDLKQHAHAGGYINTQYTLKPFTVRIQE